MALRPLDTPPCFPSPRFSMAKDDHDMGYFCGLKESSSSCLRIFRANNYFDKKNVSCLQMDFKGEIKY